MTGDANDAAAVEGRRARRKARATETQTDIAWMLDHPQGRRVLRRMIEATGVDRLSHTPGDPLMTAFREGQRSIGIFINTEITSASDNGLSIVLGESISDE